MTAASLPAWRAKNGIFLDKQLIMSWNKQSYRFKSKLVVPAGGSGSKTAVMSPVTGGMMIKKKWKKEKKKSRGNSCNSTLADRWAVLIDLPLAVPYWGSGKDHGRSGAGLITIWKQPIIRTPEYLPPAEVALLLPQDKHGKSRSDGR